MSSDSGTRVEVDERLDDDTLDEQRLDDDTLDEQRLDDDTLDEQRLDDDTLDEQRLDDTLAGRRVPVGVPDEWLFSAAEKARITQRAAVADLSFPERQRLWADYRIRKLLTLADVARGAAEREAVRLVERGLCSRAEAATLLGIGRRKFLAVQGKWTAYGR